MFLSTQWKILRALASGLVAIILRERKPGAEDRAILGAGAVAGNGEDVADAVVDWDDLGLARPLGLLDYLRQVIGEDEVGRCGGLFDAAGDGVGAEAKEV